MKEAVKFTFTSEASERSIIWRQLDNKFIMIEEAVHWPSNQPLPMDEQHPLMGDATVDDPMWPACQAVGGHRQISEIWFDAECNSGEHILQFDLIPMNALTNVTLESIELSGINYTPQESKLSDVLTTYQLVSVDPTRVGKPWPSTATGEIVTKDLNRDNQLDSNKYYKFNWTNEQTIYGRGSWQFKFSCPFVEWFESTFH